MNTLGLMTPIVTIFIILGYKNRKNINGKEEEESKQEQDKEIILNFETPSKKIRLKIRQDVFRKK